MTIRILLADDHQLMSEGLRLVIERAGGMCVVGVAVDGREAVELAATLQPHVVIMDMAMPNLNGIEATRQIRTAWPKMRVIALSMHADKRYVRGAIDAGVSGYLLKDCAVEELALAVRTVVDQGRMYLSPGISQVLAEQITHPASSWAGASAVLSMREREVLQLIAEGVSTRAIANRLHLSAKTVETHRRNIMEKLGLHSVAELTKFAIREGLTQVDH